VTFRFRIHQATTRQALTRRLKRLNRGPSGGAGPGSGWRLRFIRRASLEEMRTGSEKGKEIKKGKKRFWAFFILFVIFASPSPFAMESGFKNALLLTRLLRKTEVIRLGQQFDLKINQEALVEGEGLTVGFESVLEDSRCPEGAVCVWSGNAKIRLKLSKQKQAPASVELNTHAGSKSSSYLNYEIRLVELKPRPKADKPVQSDEYNATLIVTKK